MPDAQHHTARLPWGGLITTVCAPTQLINKANNTLSVCYEEKRLAYEARMANLLEQKETLEKAWQAELDWLEDN